MEFKDKAIDDKYSDLMADIAELESELRDKEDQVNELIANHEQE